MKKATLLKQYKLAFLITGILVSFPTAPIFVGGIASLDIYAILIGGTVFLGWWAAYGCLQTETRNSFALSFGIMSLAWSLMFVETLRRFLFVIQNKGMEGPDGYGSPVAFLLGFIFEQFLFIPLTITLRLGIKVLLDKKHKGTPDKG